MWLQIQIMAHLCVLLLQESHVCALFGLIISSGQLNEVVARKFGRSGLLSLVEEQIDRVVSFVKR